MHFLNTFFCFKNIYKILTPSSDNSCKPMYDHGGILEREPAAFKEMVLQQRKLKCKIFKERQNEILEQCNHLQTMTLAFLTTFVHNICMSLICIWFLPIRHNYFATNSKLGNSFIQSSTPIIPSTMISTSNYCINPMAISTTGSDFCCSGCC